MTFTVTTESKVLKSNVTENIEVLTDTSDGGSKETAISIDYTLYYSRIATALETIANSSVQLVANIADINSNVAMIRSNVFQINSNIAHINSNIARINSNVAMIRSNITDINSNTFIISSEMVSIDNHLDTQGSPNNLAKQYVVMAQELKTLNTYFDVDVTDNLASHIVNIDYSGNPTIELRSFKIGSVSGSFVIGERATIGSVQATVMLVSGPNMHIGAATSNIISVGSAITGLTSGATAVVTSTEIYPASGFSNDQIARAMMILNLKATDNLSNISFEIRNPTPL